MVATHVPDGQRRRQPSGPLHGSLADSKQAQRRPQPQATQAEAHLSWFQDHSIQNGPFQCR